MTTRLEFPIRSASNAGTCVYVPLILFYSTILTAGILFSSSPKTIFPSSFIYSSAFVLMATHVGFAILLIKKYPPYRIELNQAVITLMPIPILGLTFGTIAKRDMAEFVSIDAVFGFFGNGFVSGYLSNAGPNRQYFIILRGKPEYADVSFDVPRNDGRLWSTRWEANDFAQELGKKLQLKVNTK